MKKKLRFYSMPFLAFFLACSNVSCSSDDNSENEGKKLENTSWVSGNSAYHNASLVARDKVVPNTTIQAEMEEALGLLYSDTTKIEQEYLSWDLCREAGHQYDSTLTVSFNEGKCTFKVAVTKAILKAKQTATKCMYKFEEGSYLVRFGINRYEEVTVNEFGVYRPGGSLFIPLDGFGCATYETKYTYTEKEESEKDIKDYTILAEYKVSNGRIIFYYTENGKNMTFEGTVSEDGQTIILANNPIVSTANVLKK